MVVPKDVRRAARKERKVDWTVAWSVVERVCNQAFLWVPSSAVMKVATKGAQRVDLMVFVMVQSQVGRMALQVVAARDI